MNKCDLSVRAQYAGAGDFRRRIPEVAALERCKVALVGLGSIGAPMAVELARAGLGHLLISDYDYVDAGNACRWPLGIAVAGMAKVKAIGDFISSNFVWTDVRGIPRRFGTVHLGEPAAGWKPDYVILDEEFGDVDLVIDASAEEGVSHFLSDWAWRHSKDYLMVAGTSGGWGGEVVLISRSRGTGCWHCYLAAQAERDLPTPPADAAAVVQPRGCGSPTFTATGFDMQQIALVGVRVAVGHLCRGEPGGYPALDVDVFVISLRDEEGRCQPVSVASFALGHRENCLNCGAGR